jgi:GPH family glycoside/pentoside/hexuronide:cation symporter
MAIGVFAFYTAATAFLVPHLSLGAELSDDTHDRTRIYGARHIVWTLGTVPALASMGLLISASTPAGDADPRELASSMAVTVAVVTAALVLYTVSRVRERPEYQGRGGRDPFAAWRDVLRNPHARLLLIVILIESLGGATIAILTPYVAEYVIGRPELTVWFIAAYMFATVAFVPVWLPLSRRFGKKALWLFSMLLTAAAFGGMFFLEPNSVWLLTALAFTGGVAGSCGSIVSPAIQADVIDWDEYTTGERKEGSYFALWLFVFKAATGVTIVLTGYALELSGFVPNQPQGPAAVFAILALYSLFPMGCYLIGALLFARFSLDDAEHRRIRRVLDERNPL